MKRIVRVCVVVLVLSLVLGLAGCLMGGQLRSVGLDENTWRDLRDLWTDAGEESTPVQMPEGDITALEFDVGGAELIVRGGEAFSLQVLSGSVRNNRVENGVWLLESNAPDWRGSKIEVTVPADQRLERVRVDVGAGRVELENLQCETAELEVGLGAVQATDVRVYQKSKLSVDLGELKLSGGLLGETFVTCSMGNVRLKLERPEEYGYEVSSDLGSVSIDGRSYSGLDSQCKQFPEADNFYTVHCEMGNVQLDFG